MGRHWVIQTTFLYWSYYIPCLLFGLGKLPSAACAKYSIVDGTFFHMVWECPPIRTFWSEVMAFLSSLTQQPNICNPLRCLLGYIDDDSISHSIKLYMHLVIFYSKKSIPCDGNHSPPTVSSWTALVNQTIPLYKLTCKVWSLWVYSVQSVSFDD